MPSPAPPPVFSQSCRDAGVPPPPPSAERWDYSRSRRVCTDIVYDINGADWAARWRFARGGALRVFVVYRRADDGVGWRATADCEQRARVLEHIRRLAVPSARPSQSVEDG